MGLCKILLIGLPGSGKSTMSILLKEKGWAIISAGDVIRELARSDNCGVTRSELQEYGKKLLMEKGDNHFAMLLAAKVDNTRNVVFEGIRPPGVINSLKSIFPDLLDIYIHASPEDRFDRLKSRDGLTEDQFRLLESHPMEKQVIALSKKTKTHIHNTGTIHDSFQELINIIQCTGTA